MKIMKKQALLILILTFAFACLHAQNQQVAVQPEGSGSAADPYKITSLENLYWMSQNTNYFVYKHVKQMNNIDASDTKKWKDGNLYKGFTPIGTHDHAFMGHYDGNGYTISKLYINRNTDEDIALFGYINKGSIKNLELSSANINGKTRVGGIAGSAMNTKIENCCVINQLNTGTSSGIFGSSNMAGGLVGYSSRSEIKNSYCSSSVSGNEKVGGLIGMTNNYTKIINCYFTGKHHSETTIKGGLVGDANSNTTVTNSFWDLGAEISTSPLGEGKTSEEMKDPCTFTAAGWDFKEETTNGTADVWGMRTGFRHVSFVLDTFFINCHVL